MILIGLTGGIAAGKSTVSSIFSKEYGIPIVDADLIARKVVEPGKTGWKRVKKHFGDEILNQDGTINREKLANIIFNDRKKRHLLNKNLHGLIAFEMFKQIFVAFCKGYRFIILDVPLLFEVKVALKTISYTIVVDCKEKEEQVRRLLDRNRELTKEDAELRISSQLGNDEKLKLADFVIDNSGDLNNTKFQCKKLFEFFNKSNLYLRIRIGLFILSSLMVAKIIF